MYNNNSVVSLQIKIISVCQYVYWSFVYKNIPFPLQFSKKAQPSSASESEGDGGSDGSDASSMPIITNPSSRKTLFKGKGKGVGKSSSHTTSKGYRQMELVEKVNYRPL